MKRNIVVSKSNNTKRNAKYRAKKGNKTKKDSSSSEENKELPVGAELLIAASVPAMLVGTLVAGIGLLSTESALAGSNGNGDIVATPVSTFHGCLILLLFELWPHQFDKHLNSGAFGSSTAPPNAVVDTRSTFVL